jgi:GNAT superfamily N-acetyltransferase
MLALSALDTQRFGFPVAKGTLSEPETGEKVALAARRIGARLAIVRLPAQFLASAQSLEACGAALCDTLVYFRRKLAPGATSGLSPGYACTPAGPQDADELASLAREAFAGYLGHYHADPRLSPAICDEIYSSWAGNSCRDASLASHVLLVRDASNALAAFATIKRHDAGKCEGVLFGVSPQHQGRGMYAFLIDEASRWSASEGARELVVSTQITNTAVQKVWCRAGFEPYEYLYTFHLWLDD